MTPRSSQSPRVEPGPCLLPAPLGTHSVGDALGEGGVDGDSPGLCQPPGGGGTRCRAALPHPFSGLADESLVGCPWVSGTCPPGSPDRPARLGSEKAEPRCRGGWGEPAIPGLRVQGWPRPAGVEWVGGRTIIPEKVCPAGPGEQRAGEEDTACLWTCGRLEPCSHLGVAEAQLPARPGI